MGIGKLFLILDEAGMNLAQNQCGYATKISGRKLIKITLRWCRWTAPKFSVLLKISETLRERILCLGYGCSANGSTEYGTE